ncbi:MAG TPA: HNH endonuclease signature motif containing protein, partial [Candidatus Nanopelagicales bacterium]|nr:HNH endonuclease signature motif containing protein [Candidatus Nanopelagicales bacterium]
DPVTGHLLDYGREQYLPDKLRDYILARDHCRAPGCTVRALSRLEMDHAIPFPQGPTSAANTGGLCRSHHQHKTAGLVDIEDSAADGSATWVTGWGQRITLAPRPFLHDPADRPPELAATPPESQRPQRPPTAPVEWDPETPVDPDVPPF